MSKKVPEQRVEKVSLEAVMARLNQLRDAIAVLQDQVNILSSELTELQMAISTLKGLEEVTSDRKVLVAVDRLASVFIPATIGGEWSNNVLVSIGRNYYARVDREKAVGIINKRIRRVQEILKIRNQELSRAINEYNYLQQVLQTAYQQLVQQTIARQQRRQTAG